MQLILSTSELSALKKLQYDASNTSSYVKVTCILMLAKEVPVTKISDFLGIDISTIYRYSNSYVSHGISYLLETHYKGYWGILSSTQIRNPFPFEYNYYVLEKKDA